MLPSLSSGENRPAYLVPSQSIKKDNQPNTTSEALYLTGAVNYLTVFLLVFCLSPGLAFGQWTNIPDPAFEQFLVDANIDNTLDGRVFTDNIDHLPTLEVEGLGITNLTGLEDFSSLVNFGCTNTSVTSINLTSKSLRNATIQRNPDLTSVSAALLPVFDFAVITGNPLLNRLEMLSNDLNIFFLRDNPAITFIDLSGNRLESLDLSPFPALENLNVSNNSLTSLSTTNNPALKTIRCSDNLLTDLYIGNNTALEFLLCNNNHLTSLDLRLNTSLTWLDCSDNRLTSLDVRNGNNRNILGDAGYYLFITLNNSLECISVDDAVWATTNFRNVDPSTIFSSRLCEFTTIPDQNFEQKLINLGLHTGLTFGKVLTETLDTIKYLDISNSAISDLTGIEDFSSLESLFCSNNSLTTINTSQNAALLLLDCSLNQISGLDLSHNTALIGLICNGNSLTSLDLSQNPAFSLLTCNDNDLISLNVKNGNNRNFSRFFNGYTFGAQNNDLDCIIVDDPAWSRDNWPGRDAGTYYGTDCLCPSPSWSSLSADATATTADANCVDDNGWTHYLNSGNEEVLLSLQIGSSGAVVPPTAVTIDPDGGTNMFWVPSVPGNFVEDGVGAVFMRRKWDVAPSTPPTSPVGVRFYYTSEEYDAVNDEISNRGGVRLANHTELRALFDTVRQR